MPLRQPQAIPRRGFTCCPRLSNGGKLSLTCRLAAQALPLHRTRAGEKFFIRCRGCAISAAAARRGPFRRMKSDYQELLPEISAEMASKILFDDLAQMLTEDIPRRLGAAGAIALRYVPADETFTALSSPDVVLLSSHPFVQRLLKTERSITRAEMDSQGNAELSAFMEAHHIALSIPLRRGTMLIGAYNLGPKLSGEPYDEDDRHLLDMLAWHIAASLENAHLYEELRIHHDHLAELVDKHTTQIRNEQQKLATILANVGDAILIIDTDGLIEYVNNTWVRQSGFSPQEILGTDVRRFYEQPFSTTMVEMFWETMQQWEGWRGEATHRRKDSESFPVELAVAPLRDERNAVTHFVISQRDMSAHKELERFKADFISDVSHELRAPITNFKLYLDLMTDGPPECCDSISVFLERLGDKLNDEQMGITARGDQRIDRWFSVQGIEARISKPELVRWLHSPNVCFPPVDADRIERSSFTGECCLVPESQHDHGIGNSDVLLVGDSRWLVDECSVDD